MDLEQIKEHFKNAKEVRCLSDGMIYKIDKKNNVYFFANDIWTTDTTDRTCVLLYRKSTEELAEIVSYKDDVREIEVEAEEINPKYYDITITNKNNEFIKCDFFDISNALGLSNEQFSALKYFRVKGGIDKQLNDTDKAIKCLERFKDKLNNEN